MSKRFFGLIALGCVLVLGPGCYSTQEGRLKAGVPFSKDTITSRYELPYDTVYEATKAVLRREGALTSDDQVTKVLRAVVQNSNIWVKLDDSERRVTQISIQARSKGGSAYVDLASEIDKLIYGELITGQ